MNTKIYIANDTDSNTYEIKDSAVTDGDLTENTVSLKALYNEDTLYDIALTSEYSQSSGDFDAVLTADAMYSDTITLSADGNINVNADKWAIELDSLSLEQSGEKADLSVDFEISSLKNNIEKPDGEVLEIFGKDKDEAGEIVSAAGEKLYAILGKLR